MGEARIKAGIWVSAALRLGDQAGKPGVIVRKGDADAGSIILILHGRAGSMVLTQARGAEGELVWLRGTGPEPVKEEAAENYVERQIAYDSDLWIVEFDTVDYSPPFEARII